MKRFSELIERLDFNFNFTNMLFLNYRLQSLKNELCFTNVLSHLLFCNRSPNSNRQCRLCSRLYVQDANDFVSSIKYQFSLTNNKISGNEVELSFVNSRRMRFSLDVLHSSETHFQVVDSKQNCSMIFFSC